MKEKIEISKYSIIDDQYDEIINLHKNLYLESKLYGKLIYFDSNFSDYFKEIIKLESQNSVIVLKLNNIIKGFIHYKYIEDSLFLNSISLHKDIQSKGYGSDFLKKSLQHIDTSKLQYFELDVLESNTKAFNWYCKMGLEIKDKVEMLEIKKFTGAEKLDNTHTIKTDDNGFVSLINNGIKKGTIVKSETLILHNTDSFNNIFFRDYSTILANDKHINKSDFEFNIVETTLRMKGLLKNIVSNL